ncbi:MAG: CoA transferase [Candidatus Sericytochromatia bacterium]
MKALEGIRVLDLSRVVSGPYCTMMLGDLGAEVIKIEHPDIKDETRLWGPPFHQTREDSAYYLAMNRNKKSLTLNFKTNQGKKILKQLIEQSDVLVENFRTGVMEKLGFSYEEAKELNPQLIYCSISGFGRTGTYANKGGYDVLMQGFGGMMSINGETEEPMKVGIPVIDLTTAMLASQSIIAALFYRSRTGNGQYIETSLMEAQISLLSNVGSNFLMSGKLPKKLGNAHPNIVPYQPYKAKNGMFIITVTNEKLWKNFCFAIKKENLSNDEKFKTNELRVKNRNELNQILEELFIEKNIEEWVELFEKNEIPAGPINNLEQVFSNEQVLHRNMVIEKENQYGKVKMTGLPVKFSESKTEIELLPPVFGEHTEEIIKKLLRYSDEEYLELKTNNII